MLMSKKSAQALVPSGDAAGRGGAVFFLMTLVVLAASAIVPELAHAGTALPWDGPLTTLRNNLTGPVATAISVVAFLAAGAALVFGGDDLGSIAKRILYIVLGIALIVLGNGFLTALGLAGAGGALVPLAG